MVVAVVGVAASLQSEPALKTPVMQRDLQMCFMQRDRQMYVSLLVIFVRLIVFIERSLQVRVTRSEEHLVVRNASSLKEALPFVAVPLQMGKAEPEEKSSDAAQPTAKPQSSETRYPKPPPPPPPIAHHPQPPPPPMRWPKDPSGSQENKEYEADDSWGPSRVREDPSRPDENKEEEDDDSWGPWTGKRAGTLGGADDPDCAALVAMPAKAMPAIHIQAKAWPWTPKSKAKPKIPVFFSAKAKFSVVAVGRTPIRGVKSKAKATAKATVEPTARVKHQVLAAASKAKAEADAPYAHVRPRGHWGRLSPPKKYAVSKHQARAKAQTRAIAQQTISWGEATAKATTEDDWLAWSETGDKDRHHWFLTVKSETVVDHGNQSEVVPKTTPSVSSGAPSVSSGPPPWALDAGTLKHER